MSDPAVVAIVCVVAPVLAIILIAFGYFWLQRYRADAVAMASYRKLAEQAVDQFSTLRGDLHRLDDRVATVEKLIKDVG